MRPTTVLAHAFLGCVLLSTGCMKLDFWRRAESPKLFARAPRVGTPAPEIEGEDFDGQPVKLSDYRGKVVVVAFWASWCRPCRDMIPHERALVERFQDQPFVMLGVNNDEEDDAARRVIASQRMTWRNLRTGGSDCPVNHRWKIEAWPSVYVIDANGIIRYTRLSGPNLEQAVATLLAEMKGKQS